MSLSVPSQSLTTITTALPAPKRKPVAKSKSRYLKKTAKVLAKPDPPADTRYMMSSGAYTEPEHAAAAIGVGQTVSTREEVGTRLTASKLANVADVALQQAIAKD